MGKRYSSIIVLFVILAGIVLSSGCVFGPNRYYAVMSHRGNRVFITHDHWYYVGKLPDDWENLKTRARAASWYNALYRSTISTDVFCETTAADRSLSSVASEIASSVEDRKVTKSSEFMLDGRGALREKVVGFVDGVPLAMDVVVTKKNNCAFNMAAVMPPEEVSNVAPVFEEFILGFHFE